MNWLLWREYRLNRAILAFCSLLIFLPYVAAAAAVASGEDRVSAFFEAYLATTACSAIIIAAMTGNSIAGERSDRSAEFVAYLVSDRERFPGVKTLSNVLKKFPEDRITFVVRALNS